jgi:hypothetical protein
MSEQQVIVTVEIEFPVGKKEIKMQAKDRDQISECAENKVVVIYLVDGQQYTGIFKGMDGSDDIMLSNLLGKNTIGLQVNWIKAYLEEIKICYKSNEPCKYDCQGLCKESV